MSFWRKIKCRYFWFFVCMWKYDVFNLNFRFWFLDFRGFSGTPTGTCEGVQIKKNKFMTSGDTYYTRKHHFSVPFNKTWRSFDSQWRTSNRRDLTKFRIFFSSLFGKSFLGCASQCTFLRIYTGLCSRINFIWRTITWTH